MIARRRQLIRESEWERIYQSDQWGRIHESKFLVDGIQVSAESIVARWPELSEAEKLEFASAFSVKPKVTPEDERILDFLMGVEEPHIWGTIAALLPRHSNRDHVLEFLLARVREESPMKPNYYQSLEELNDRRAVPVLRANFEHFESKLQAQGKLQTEDEYLDYLCCSRTLWVIDGSKEYQDSIRRQAESPDEKVRFWAERILRQDQ